MPIDLDAALRSLRRNLSPRPDRHCARHVREALEAAGFDTTGHPVDACDYGPFLKHLGFVRLPDDASMERLPGDIRVWQGPPSEPPGHIAMWSEGSGDDGHDAHWVADFAMKTDLPGEAFVGVAFATYRFGSAA